MCRIKLEPPVGSESIECLVQLFDSISVTALTDILIAQFRCVALVVQQCVPVSWPVVHACLRLAVY